MNRTLQDVLEETTNFYNTLQMQFISMSNDEIQHDIHHLQENIAMLQNISYYTAKICNVATRAIKSRSHKVRKVIQCEPTDYTVQSVIYASCPRATLCEGIKIPTRIVQSISDIPQSYLYYVLDTNSYMLNCNGICISGNLCNVVSGQSPYSARCMYRGECKNIATCSYYHTPEERALVGCDSVTRTLSSGSFLYTSDWKKRNYYTRHIGDKKNILRDIAKLRKNLYVDEVETREAQLMHDFLIYLILNEKELVNKYNREIQL